MNRELAKLDWASDLLKAKAAELEAWEPKGDESIPRAHRLLFDHAAASGFLRQAACLVESAVRLLERDP